MANEILAPINETTDGYTNARIQKFNIVSSDGNNELVYKDVPIAVSGDEVYLTNPVDANNVLLRTLKDVLFAQYTVDNDGIVSQTGYHDIDLDVWSVAQALTGIEADLLKRVFGIYDTNHTPDGIKYIYTNKDFLGNKNEAENYLKTKTSLSDEQTELLLRGLTSTSLIQEIMNFLSSYNSQMYAIPVKTYYYMEGGEIVRAITPLFDRNSQDIESLSTDKFEYTSFEYMDKDNDSGYETQIGSFLNWEDVKRYYAKETVENGKTYIQFLTTSEAKELVTYFFSRSFADLMLSLKGDWFASLSSDSADNTEALAVMTKDEIDNLFLTRKKEGAN